MKKINIYSDRESTITAATFISKNRKTAFIQSMSNGSSNYYNVNGIVWEWWHEGLGSYPMSDGTKVN